MICTQVSLAPRPPPAFFDCMLQAIKAGDKAGDIQVTRDFYALCFGSILPYTFHKTNK